MKDAVISMFSSKKFLVFLSTVLTALIVLLMGVSEEQAAHYVDKLVSLAMAYMGGQGVADAGKYFGEALKKPSDEPTAPAADPDADA